MDKDTVDILMQFNENAERILDSRFTKHISDNPLTLSIITQSGSAHTELQIPDEEYISSLILTLRLFIQDRDMVSINALSKIYSKQEIPKDYSTQFKRIRNEILTYLDNDVPTINGVASRKYVDIFNIIVYGHYAHQNKVERKKFIEIQKDNVAYSVYYFNFIHILKQYTIAIDKIRELNLLFIEWYNSRIN